MGWEWRLGEIRRGLDGSDSSSGSVMPFISLQREVETSELPLESSSTSRSKSISPEPEPEPEPQPDPNTNPHPDSNPDPSHNPNDDPDPNPDPAPAPTLSLRSSWQESLWAGCGVTSFYLFSAVNAVSLPSSRSRQHQASPLIPSPQHAYNTSLLSPPPPSSHILPFHSTPTSCFPAPPPCRPHTHRTPTSSK